VSGFTFDEGTPDHPKLVVMSAFGSKADMKWCWDESPLLTQSGHSVGPNLVGESSVSFDLTVICPDGVATPVPPNPQ